MWLINCVRNCARTTETALEARWSGLLRLMQIVLHTLIRLFIITAISHSIHGCWSWFHALEYVVIIRRGHALRFNFVEGIKSLSMTMSILEKKNNKYPDMWPLTCTLYVCCIAIVSSKAVCKWG